MARDVIFVPLGGGEDDRAVAETARALSKTLDAAVEAVFVGVDQASIAMAASDAIAAGVAMALREERAHSEAAARALAEEFGFALTIHAQARGRAAWRARLAVLAIVDARSARGEGSLADVFEGLLLEERAPVLVPRGAPSYDNIAVAWDGSREAANALKAAEPFITRARSVTVLQAPDRIDAKDLDFAEPERARSWIQRRNEDAKIKIATLDFDPARSIATIAQGYSPVDLLVAGAYGHARLREAVFGGATRSLLRAEAPSLLLAH